MSVNKNDEGEECFVDQDTEDTHFVHIQDIRVDISRHFHQQQPANQLRTARRPQNMAPRTFFLERPLYRLNEVINRPCQQQIITIPQMDQTKLKLKIANSQNLPLQLYFLKNKFKCVYNKLQTYRNDCKSFQGRLKGVDSLIDYNWKCFKELEDEQKTVRTFSSDKIDSDFESGNMCRAYTSSQEENEHYLLIENDLNTYGYNNWFFFRFRNVAKGVRRFVIVNMIKKTSFFSQGMMISIFSVKKDRYYNRSWFKGGTKITFGTTNFTRNNHANEYYSSLSFQYDFQYENDEVYFALNQPYTYSRLVTFIKNAQMQTKSIEMQVKTIGYSISNNIIPAIRFSKREEAKEIILILARQHPCETVGSFVAEKIMQNLIELDEISQFLLNQFEFMIVPMVNPDGVIHGVSRCNMAGLDLNRQWGENVIKELAPQTIKIKQFITNLSKTKKIRYMIDLHGHGKKLNTFFFSCKNNEKENIRLLSMSMKKVQPRFDIYGCTYGISRDKQNTIRSKINSMGIVHSYTLETSLFGWKDEEGQIRHFNQEDYESIAKSVIKSIFLIEAEPKLSLQKIGISRDDIVSQMARFNEKANLQDDRNYENTQILSESDPQGDKLDVKILLGNCENKALKKKLQDQYDSMKKPKTKRSKKLNRADTNDRFSSKNMRESCPSELYVKTKTTTSNSDYKPGLINGKKPSINQKWELKRREIKKKQANQMQAEEQRKNYTKTEFRSRIKTEAEPIRIKKPHLPYSSFMAKHPTYHHQKIKTEFKQAQQMNQDTHQQVVEMNRRSALQLKFKQLQKQQESLKVILTETLCVSKINPNDNPRQLSPGIRQQKNCSLMVKKEHMLTQALKSQPVSKMATVDESQGLQKDSVRYKKFRQFLNSGISSKKMQKKTNSVFYYFPIL